MNEEIPIKRLNKLREKMSEAISASKWDEAEILAKKMIGIIPLAVNIDTCRTGKPHLDGVIAVGADHYLNATKGACRAIGMFNRILKTARRTVRKRRK